MPSDEPVQAAGTRDQIGAGSQEEMVGIAKNDLGADVLQIAVGDRLDRSACANRHEGGGLHHPVRRPQFAATRCAVAVGDPEVECAGGHPVILA